MLEIMTDTQFIAQLMAKEFQEAKEQIQKSIFSSEALDNRLNDNLYSIYRQTGFVLGIILGVLFLLDYEVDQARPEPKIAVSLFFMAFIFTQLVWLSLFFINHNAHVLRFNKNSWVRKVVLWVINLSVVALYMQIWTTIDHYFGLESSILENFGGVNQVRGLFIFTTSILLTWGLEQGMEKQKARDTIANLEEENFQAKYEILKQQVNPHFLFNSLNILKSMIRTQNVNAEEYVVRLAEVYRYILQSNTQDAVPMNEEIRILEAYVFMLKTRFREAIHLKIDLSEATRKTAIPPLTFQLLVENCVKHNTLTQTKPLLIEIFEENKHIVVRNNLQPKSALENSNQVGLENLKQRYLLLNGENVLIEKTPQYFKVCLPII